MASTQAPSWFERLPAVRGRYAIGADLSRITWFRAGGPADVVFWPADVEDLADFLANRPAEVPVTVVGVGSNLLVRDGGVEGVVIRLRQGFRDVTVNWDGTRALVEVGAGALDVSVARFCRDQGVDGLAFLTGVPGTIGGALRMNAGAYGREMADVVVEARALDANGAVHTLSPDAFGFSYRHSSVPDDWIFVSAVLAGQRGDPAEIARHMDEIDAAREASQPIRTRTGGSTFTNPAEQKAWELIDQAGCRGLTRGGAQVSEKHCNFLVNTGSATAADIESLGEEVRRRVKEQAGITLEWEIQRIGRYRTNGPVGEDTGGAAS
jgi:UDP-N-acetylmuramate dehydrogenase